MSAAANLTPTYPLHIAHFTIPGYTALYTVILNIAVAAVLTFVFRALGAAAYDETVASDYYA